MSTMEERAAERHDMVAIDITRKLATHAAMMAMTPAEVLVVLESILVGFLSSGGPLMADPIMVDEFAKHVKERLLLARKTKGRA